MDKVVEQMAVLQNRYLESESEKNWIELEAFYGTPEYKALPYLIRNRGFITAHKLAEFKRCSWCFSQKYIYEIPDPSEDVENEAFILGQAVDDFLTEGTEVFHKKYEVVIRRSTKMAILTGKIQLTQGQWESIQQMILEFKQQYLFDSTPKKKIILFKGTGDLAGMVLKAELDDINELQRMIKDVKTCANIKTFSPSYYLLQATFYNLLVELKFAENYEVMLEIVDKNRAVSRSMALIYTRPTLQSQRGYLLGELIRANKAIYTGIFSEAEDQDVLYDCPYYGYQGHGRPTEPKYY